MQPEADGAAADRFNKGLIGLHSGSDDAPATVSHY